MDQFERLEDIFKNNNNKGMAVAITGQWGIGKTFFWNKFINERAKREEERKYLPFSITQKHPNLFNKKYAYISLFGVESLADLKTAICTKLSSNHFNEFSSKNIETPILLKKFISQFRDIKVSQYGVSASARLIESFLFAQVNNAIICFDDFERMSNKLDIKDVMGLANQLKLERNCQVILILDEDKAEGENKKKYAEYKEKLIDETIKITSVEPLIRARAKEENIDEPLINLMVKFADELEIHNFRFFQKVIKLYEKFLEQLPEQVADSTKEIILIRVLQGYFIEEFGISCEFHWDDVKLVLEDQQQDWSEKKIKTYENLKSLNYYFVYQDQWLIEFRKWFDQKGNPDFVRLNCLANSNLISEKNNNIRFEIDQLMQQWRNLEIDSQFCQKLYDTSCKRIGFENLNFYCDLLDEFGAKNLSVQLEEKIKEWLFKEYVNKGDTFIEDQFSFGIKLENKLHSYLQSLKDEMPYQGLPTLIDIIYRYIEHSGWNSNTDPQVFRLATKNDWKNLIFNEISKDERFKEFHKLGILRKILSQQINVELQPQINALIFGILDDEAKVSSPERQKNIEYVIKRLKE